MIPMDDRKIQNLILNSLSPIEPIWSNKLARDLRVNKNNYTKNRNKLIKEGYIITEKKKNQLLLRLATFGNGKLFRRAYSSAWYSVSSSAEPPAASIKITSGASPRGGFL